MATTTQTVKSSDGAKVEDNSEVGLGGETLEIQQDEATVADVLRLIARKHPAMDRFVDTATEEAHRHHMVVALNSQLAKLTDSIREGDRIAILLPVIGG